MKVPSDPFEQRHRLLKEAREFCTRLSGAQALVKLATSGAWRKLSGPDAVAFATFVEFVTTNFGDGLGLKSHEEFRVLRAVLLDADLLHLWAQVLSVVAKPRGNPAFATAGPLCVYTPKAGGHSVDRAILKLRDEHHEDFEQLASGAITLEQALAQAGLRKSMQPVDQVKRAMHKLNAADKEQVILAYLEGLSLHALKNLQAVIAAKLSAECVS